MWLVSSTPFAVTLNLNWLLSPLSSIEDHLKSSGAEVTSIPPLPISIWLPYSSAIGIFRWPAVSLSKLKLAIAASLINALPLIITLSAFIMIFFDWKSSCPASMLIWLIRSPLDTRALMSFDNCDTLLVKSFVLTFDWIALDSCVICDLSALLATVDWIPSIEAVICWIAATVVAFWRRILGLASRAVSVVLLWSFAIWNQGCAKEALAGAVIVPV